jgi:hypothetical protein
MTPLAGFLFGRLYRDGLTFGAVRRSAQRVPFRLRTGYADSEPLEIPRDDVARAVLNTPQTPRKQHTKRGFSSQDGRRGACGGRIDTDMLRIP